MMRTAARRRAPSSSSTSQRAAEHWFVERYGRPGIPAQGMMGEWRVAVGRHHRWPEREHAVASWAATMNGDVVALRRLIGEMRKHAAPLWRARDPEPRAHPSVFARAAPTFVRDGARSRFLRQVAARARFDEFVAAADRFLSAWDASAFASAAQNARRRGHRRSNDVVSAESTLVIEWARHVTGEVTPALAALAAIALEVDAPCKRPDDFEVRREKWKRRCTGARDHETT